MKDKFSMANLQELQRSLEGVKKEIIEEKVFTSATDNTPIKEGKGSGRDFLMKLKNSVDTGRPNQAVTKIAPALNEAVAPKGSAASMTMPDVPLTSRGLNRDDDNHDFYDEQVRLRMQKAANKIQEAVTQQPRIIEEQIHAPQRNSGGSMMINEQQLFELAQKAVNGAIANLYSKEKIREAILEEKKEIKKIVYETLQELRNLNEQKKKTGK
jgi:hypothetical protein